MRTVYVAIIVVTVIVFTLLMSCDLFSDGTVYFYSMVNEDEGPSNYKLRYRNDGWIIKMTLGEVDEKGFDTKEEALSYVGKVTFTLTVDGEPIDPVDLITVEQHGDNRWHVVKPYRVTLNKGEYEVFGTTVIEEKGFSRENTVFLTIY